MFSVYITVILVKCYAFPQFSRAWPEPTRSIPIAYLGASDSRQRGRLRTSGGAAQSDCPGQHARQAHGGLRSEEGRREVFRPEHPGG